MDDMAHSEHVPANGNSFYVVLLSVRASIVTAATKDQIVSTKEACDEGLEPDTKPVDPIPGRTHECNSAVVPDLKLVDQPLKGNNVESGVVPDMKPVDQCFEGENHTYKSKMVPDVTLVNQPLEGKNDLQIAHATGFLNGGVFRGHFVQQVEVNSLPGLGFRNPKYDVTQLLDEGVTG